MNTKKLSTLFCSLPISLLLSGCALSTTATDPVAGGLAIQGSVHGGQQPVVGAHIYLMAANTQGNAGPGIAPSTTNLSTSLLSAAATGNVDSTGAYVTTNSKGYFTIDGDYTCTANTQVYILALGGNPGAGTNSAAGFMALLGNCPTNGTFMGSIPYIAMNEVSTVAAAYAISGYATDSTHVASSGSTQALLGIANAFANATNLVSLSSGAAYTSTPAGNGTVPQATINTLANILATCVNSTGPGNSNCTTLLSNARSGGSTGTTPTDTASAAINIAHNPGSNVSTLYYSTPPASAFSPALTNLPNDFTIAINFTNGNSSSSGNNGALSLAIDAAGNAWVTDVANGALSEFSSLGTVLSPAAGFSNSAQFIPIGIAIDLAGDPWIESYGALAQFNTSGTQINSYTGGGVSAPQALAIDGNANVWIASFGNSTLNEFNSSGVSQAGTTGFTGGGLNQPQALAIDNAEAVWVGNQSPGNGSLSKFSNAGVPVNATGFTGGGIDNPFGIAIDASGNAWVANYGNSVLSEFNSSGTPVSSSGYTGGGLSEPYAVIVDGGGNVWTANYYNSTVSEFSNAGAAISPSTGYTSGLTSQPQSIAVDASGNVWVGNSYTGTPATLTEIIGASVPVVTPLSAAAKAGTLGTRP